MQPQFLQRKSERAVRIGIFVIAIGFLLVASAFAEPQPLEPKALRPGMKIIEKDRPDKVITVTANKLFVVHLKSADGEWEVGWKDVGTYGWEFFPVGTEVKSKIIIPATWSGEIHCEGVNLKGNWESNFFLKLDPESVGNAGDFGGQIYNFDAYSRRVDADGGSGIDYMLGSANLTTLELKNAIQAVRTLRAEARTHAQKMERWRTTVRLIGVLWESSEVRWNVGAKTETTGMTLIGWSEESEYGVDIEFPQHIDSDGNLSGNLISFRGTNLDALISYMEFELSHPTSYNDAWTSDHERYVAKPTPKGWVPPWKN